jgi:RNA polymerase sigma-70 factor, sigma-B/F/G subfamily
MLESTYENIIKAQQGNTEVLESLVKNNMGLVYNIAKRFVGRGYEIEDLNQIGAMGLVKSIKKFDTNYNVQLSTYAVPFIIGEIKRYIRDDGRIKVSRSIKELAVKINQIQKEAMDKNGEELKVEQIAEILNVPKEEIALALDANSASVVTSINEPVYNDKSGKKLCIEDTIASDKDEENKIADKLTIKKLVEELNSQEQEIVMLRYYKGKTQTEVAKKLGISQVQVSRIEKRILYSMKQKLVI